MPETLWVSDLNRIRRLPKTKVVSIYEGDCIGSFLFRRRHLKQESLALFQGLRMIASDWSNLSKNLIGFVELAFGNLWKSLLWSFLNASKIDGVWNVFTVGSWIVFNGDDGLKAMSGISNDFGTRWSSGGLWGALFTFILVTSRRDVGFCELLLRQLLIGFLIGWGLSNAFSCTLDM